MIKELIRLATHLDRKGLRREADYIDGAIRRYAQQQEASALELALTTAVATGLKGSPPSQKDPWGWMSQASAVVDPNNMKETYPNLTMDEKAVKALKVALKSQILASEGVKGMTSEQQQQLADYAVDNSLIVFARIENGALLEW